VQSPQQCSSAWYLAARSRKARQSRPARKSTKPVEKVGQQIEKVGDSIPDAAKGEKK
jgi:hypothetical protein